MRIMILILLVLLAVLNHRLWLSDDGGFQKVWLLQDAIKAQDNENKSLKERNRTLEAEVKDLKEGFAAVEERARLELGMIRQGETFFHILEGLPSSATVPAGQKLTIQQQVVQRQQLAQEPVKRQPTTQKSPSKPVGRQPAAQKSPLKQARWQPAVRKPARSQPVQGPRLTRHDD